MNSHAVLLRCSLEHEAEGQYHFIIIHRLLSQLPPNTLFRCLGSFVTPLHAIQSRMSFRDVVYSHLSCSLVQLSRPPRIRL